METRGESLTPGDPANDNSLHEVPTVYKRTTSGDLRSILALHVGGFCPPGLP